MFYFFFFLVNQLLTYTFIVILCVIGRSPNVSDAHASPFCPLLSTAFINGCAEAQVGVCCDLAVVRYCFRELCKNKGKYVSKASTGVGTTPRRIYHLLVLPPAEWGESRPFSTAVITSPLTLFLLFLRNSLMASPSSFLLSASHGGKKHYFTSFLLLTW